LKNLLKSKDSKRKLLRLRDRLRFLRKPESLRKKERLRKSD